MPMIRYIHAMLLLSITIILASCKNNNAPDVSNIKIQVKLLRYEKAFFKIDTSDVVQGVNSLVQQEPELTPLFLHNMVGITDMNDTTSVKSFIRYTRPIYDSVENKYKKDSYFTDVFNNAFRYLKYYFPNYRTPDIATIVGPPDGLMQTSAGWLTPNFLTNRYLAISLQFYMGAGFSLYNDGQFIETVAPLYRSRRFSEEYILPDAMLLIVDDLFPDNSKGLPLIEQMIERGKQWWLLDKLLPETADSLKTGYTQKQLNWCNENEGMIWSSIIKNEQLYSVKQVDIQTYISEGPFTMGMPQNESPGNIGLWIGRQIVKKYELAAGDKATVESIMKASPKEILETAKYKPR